MNSGPPGRLSWRAARRGAGLGVALACLSLAAAGAPPPSAQVAPEVGDFSAAQLRSILRLSPLPPPPPDESNAYAEDERAARLGERLFFDPRLSQGNKMSCATCHDPARAFSNGQRTVDVEDKFPKNVPSVRNTAYNRWFYWDGRADSAWSQALGPLENEREMASNRLALLHLVRKDRRLRRAYQEIFGPLPAGVSKKSRFPPAGMPLPLELEHPLQQAWAIMTDEDRHATNVVFSNLGKAIAAFERTIRVGEAPFDRYAAKLRKGDATAAAEIPPAAQRGLELFIGRGACTLCHSGPNFSDGEFHDIGIALGAGYRIDPGRHRGVLLLERSPFTRIGNYADSKSPNAPIRFLEGQTEQLGQFKTPTLRGVAETAPYMHDGRFETLEEVVTFYSTRQGASPLGHPTTLLQKLDLSKGEIDDLVAFLRTLSP